MRAHEPRVRDQGRKGHNVERQRACWLIDAGLFAGFVLAMLLDLTGVALHEWLGAAVGVVAGYHLLAHWQWVKSITTRLLGRASRQARQFYVVDAGLLAGFVAIGATGLVISTWLDLSLLPASYQAWRDAHVLASLATLGLLVLKIGLHWRWIVTVAERHVFGQLARSRL